MWDIVEHQVEEKAIEPCLRGFEITHPLQYRKRKQNNK